MIDCISRGRLDVGFVRGVPYEIFAANTNPTQTARAAVGRHRPGRNGAGRRHDGPFNFEGRFWHQRAVNIWPRPYQQPHPPIWITGSSDLENIRKVARARLHLRDLPAAVREGAQACSTPTASTSSTRGLPGAAELAFMPLVYTADTEAEAEKGAQELPGTSSAKTEPQFRNPPGYVPVSFNVQALQGAYSRPHRRGARAGPRLPDGAGRR